MMNYSVRQFRELELQDGKWEQAWGDGRVIYTATSEACEVKLVQPGGIHETHKYPSGTQLWVCGDIVHLPPVTDPAMADRVYRDVTL